MVSRPITNGGLYDALDRTRLEIKGDVRDLYRKVEAVESEMNALKISSIQQNDALKQNQAVLSTKFLTGAGIAIAIFNALLYAFFTRIIK